jgi:hypothetical protein
MLEWARCGFHKKRANTHCVELVFLHPVGSVGRMVHSSASGTRNVIALFSSSGGSSTDLTKSAPGHVTLKLCFCIWWDMQVT